MRIVIPQRRTLAMSNLRSKNREHARRDPVNLLPAALRLLQAGQPSLSPPNTLGQMLREVRSREQ